MRQNILRSEQAGNMNVAAKKVVFHHANIDVHTLNTVASVGKRLNILRGHFRRDQSGVYRRGNAGREPKGGAFGIIQKQANGSNAVFQLRKIFVMGAGRHVLPGDVIPLIGKPGKARSKFSFKLLRDLMHMNNHVAGVIALYVR